MESKIRIKLGQIEIEYEGSEAFLKEELSEFISSVSKLYSNLPKNAISETATNNHQGSSGNVISMKPVGTTANIASKLKAKNSRDLTLCAGAHLHFTGGKEIFTRSEIIEAMKSAPSYLGKHDIGNLSGTLKKLLNDDKFNEIGPDKYSLTASALEDLETRLAA